jgi:beta-N-acetylhexosaminidase
VSSGLERAAAGCLFPSFRGHAPAEWLRPWLARGLGGVVLFSRNVADPEQLGQLTGALRGEQPELVVGIDEEGGDVTRLEWASGSSYPGNAALGVIDDVALTQRVAGAIGARLRAAGVDLDFAPVADVNSNPANPVIGVRAFGSDPDLVARHVGAFVHGLQAAGVAACAKHFPGHGDTDVDSHLGLPVVDDDRETLRRVALPPFRAAVEAGVRSVMTAHMRVSALDDAPATVSSRVLDGLLRQELGFTGMVITDALDMRGLSDSLGYGEAGVRALAAGADALCVGPALGAREVGRLHDAIVAAVRDGRLEEGRVREAAARVAAVSRGLGAERTSLDGVGADAARRALRAEGRIALDRPLQVVELAAEPSIAAGPAAYGLADALRSRRASTVAVTVRGASARLPALDTSRDLVVAVRDAHREPWQQDVVSALLARRGDAVVVETGLPLWRPVAAAGYVATFGGGRVNLEAAAERLTASGAALPEERGTAGAAARTR